MAVDAAIRVAADEPEIDNAAGSSYKRPPVTAHSAFLEKLVDLIPPRFYLPVADEDRPWFQGLSKAAQAAAKAQTRANIRAARAARLNPSAPPASTLARLQQSAAADNDEEEEEEGDEPTDESDELLVGKEGGSAATYEELRERLHRRIAELRGNRNTRPETINKERKKKLKHHKTNKGNVGSASAAEEEILKGDSSSGGKRKRNDDNKEDDIVFGQMRLDPKEARRRKNHRVNKKQALKRAKAMDRMKQDPEKGKKVMWKTAMSRAAGEKVHDDPRLIRESMKREKKRQKKHAQKWGERAKAMDAQRAEKQSKRTENIRERAHQKKMRRIEKREKKLLRPGFEGRREGYINE